MASDKKISKIVQRDTEYELCDEYCRKLVNKLIKQIDKLNKYTDITRKAHTQYINSKRNGKAVERINYIITEKNSINNKKLKQLEDNLTKTANLINQLENKIINTESNVTNKLLRAFDVIQQQIKADEEEIVNIKKVIENSCVNRINLEIYDAKSIPIMYYKASNNDYFNYTLQYEIVDMISGKTYSNIYYLSSTSDINVLQFKLKTLFEDIPITFSYCKKRNVVYIVPKIELNNMYIKESIIVNDGIPIKVTYNEKPIKSKMEIIKDIDKERLDRLEMEINLLKSEHKKLINNTNEKSLFKMLS